MKINNQVISLFNSNFFIKEDDIVFLVFEICSKLNYKKLIDSYAKEGRPSALPINVMFMVVVYAYINGIYSSRKIEYACKTHICFEAPKSLLKEHRNLIALIADNGNHFLAYGIVEGTTLYIDLDAEYEENTLSCFINKQGQFKLFICELEGYDYVGRIIAAYKSYEV